MKNIFSTKFTEKLKKENYDAQVIWEKINEEIKDLNIQPKQRIVMDLDLGDRWFRARGRETHGLVGMIDFEIVDK